MRFQVTIQAMPGTAAVGKFPNLALPPRWATSIDLRPCEPRSCQEIHQMFLALGFFLRLSLNIERVIVGSPPLFVSTDDLSYKGL
jgi:hypothetical protein